MIFVEGTVLGTIYKNEENSYTVLELSCEDRVVVCVGNLPDLQPGEYVRFYGAYTTHRSYGEQFKVASMETRVPEDRESIRLFLGSGLIKGVGEVLALRIVEWFGEDTFTVIAEEPAKLTMVKGISPKLAQRIHERCQELTSVRAAVIELQELGLTLAQSLKVFERYGPAARELIEANPYRLIADIHGIGFESADRIAAGIGIDRFAEVRAYNGIVYVLRRQMQNGHTCLPEERLKQLACSVLDADGQEVDAAYYKLTLDGQLSRNEYNGTMAAALAGTYEAESYAAYKLSLLARSAPARKLKRDLIADTVRAASMLSEEQERAILMAADSAAAVITGGPGTGKTTILNTLLRLFDRCGLETVLCAPTGRAAKRMEETTGHPARTIHRLLEYGAPNAPGEAEEDFRFIRNEDNPLDCDAVIVDESSMIDVFLMRSLLAAIEPGTRLVLVGDADQLPSVGPGNVLKDIIASGVVGVCRLTEIFRQSGNIAMAAHSINRGQPPELFDAGDFVFLRTASAEETLELVVKRYMELEEAGERPQVICPVKKGVIGVNNLNLKIREHINPMLMGRPELKRGELIFRRGDRIMQVVNNYSKEWYIGADGVTRGFGVFNGDTGIIHDIDESARTMEILFDDGKLAVYEHSELEQLEHSYAITVHKSQGSEFDCVILPLFYGDNPFLTRNLLYTALTRAKKRVLMIGLPRTLAAMVRNDRIHGRYTCLDHELRRFDTFMGDISDGTMENSLL